VKPVNMRLKSTDGARVNVKTALSACLMLALLGCSKLTMENYTKIKVGMQYEQVTQLIGKPDKCVDVMSIRKCSWSSGKRSIIVSFAGNEVLLFSASNLN
jgi:hypothetical protein